MYQARRLYPIYMSIKYLKGYKSYGVNKVSPLKFIQGRYSKKDGRGKQPLLYAAQPSWPDIYVYQISKSQRV